MSDTNNVQTGYQSAQRNPALKKLDKLIGTWEVSGGAQGKVTYEWMEGGFFLIQHVDLNDNKGMEIIGYGRSWEAWKARIASRSISIIRTTSLPMYLIWRTTLSRFGADNVVHQRITKVSLVKMAIPSWAAWSIREADTIQFRPKSSRKSIRFQKK